MWNPWNIVWNPVNVDIWGMFWRIHHINNTHCRSCVVIFEILFAKHKLFFSISGFNSHGFSLILSGDTWKKYLSIQLFKKNEIYFLFNIPQIWVGVQRLSNCTLFFFYELFFGGFHLHCLTLSLQILIVMLSMLIRSCLTVFPMNRAPGLWDLWQDLFTVLS